MEDVIIVGGGTGGLSAALTLARIISARAVTTARLDEGFAVTLDDGSAIEGRRLVIATGVRDELPDVPGVREGWGRTVIHCPYCHGWEVRDRRIGVLGTGPGGIHQALLFTQLSDDVTLYLHSLELTDAETASLKSRNVTIVEGAIASVDSLGVDALVVSPVTHPRLDAFAGLGITSVTADFTGATEYPGVWAVGNVAEPNAQVIGAAAAGVMAGARVNWDLIENN